MGWELKKSGQIRDLKQRLANARRRVAYWSGRPSFRGFGFRPNGRKATTGGHALEYEMALDDVKSLAEDLSKLTGKTYAITDLQYEFNVKFSSRGL